jgi:hypothetical protein
MIDGFEAGKTMGTTKALIALAKCIRMLADEFFYLRAEVNNKDSATSDAFSSLFGGHRG